MNKKYYWCILLIFIQFSLSTCKKWNLTKVPTVITNPVSNVQYYSVNMSGNIIDEGGASVTDRGFCWSTKPNPTIKFDSTSSLGSGKGVFSTTTSGLLPNTRYYIRAYGTNSTGTEYGKQDSFTTYAVGMPILTTLFNLYVTDSTALCGDSLILDGGSQITALGICWDSIQNPTINSACKIFNNTTQKYNLDTIRNLRSGTTYYVRAFGTNSVGTGYGNQVTFTTGGNQIILPIVITSTISNVTNISATSGGLISSQGWAPVIERGLCWSTNHSPTIDLSTKTIDGNGTGTYTSNLSGLTVNTNYYVRAYASNFYGTSYGNELNFITVRQLPQLASTTISNITNSTASGGGIITSDGGATITARGVCWGTIPSPTVALSTKTVDGSGMGSFNSNLSGLTVNTTYYVRAYATNSVGTSYGNELSFITVAVLPTLATAPVNSITGYSANSGGNITDNGGASITARGVCWSTSPSPTIALSTKTVDGSGAGSYLSSIIPLIPGTFYYLRSYATNSAGTSYGNEITFSTPWVCGYPFTITHTGGTVAPNTVTITYNTVQSSISGSSKCWIKQNLGAYYPASSSTDMDEFAAGWYWQFNKPRGYRRVGTSMIPTPSALSINQNSDWSSSNDPCVALLGSGWRLPTGAEWSNSLASLSSPFASDLQLHFSGYIDPSSSNLYYRGIEGYIWSSTQANNINGSDLYIGSSPQTLATLLKSALIPVRCIKD